MAKRRPLEDTLTELGQLRRQPITAQTVATLRQALQSKTSHIVAKAAQVAGELELHDLASDLATAFERLLINPVRSDPRCAAKTEIVRALYQIGAGPASLLLRSIQYRQLEPVYGGKVDSAVELRTVAALGLVRINHPDLLLALAELLADPEAPARRGAARALAYSENEQAAPLLRLKVLSGDEDAEVLADCFAALLQVAPNTELEFVTRFLDGGPADLRETAALALGASRRGEALPVLRAWWEHTADVSLRATALVAIAMLRADAAHAFLFELIASANGPDARDAIAALGTFSHDAALRERVRAAVEARHDLDLRPAFREAFG